MIASLAAATLSFGLVAASFSASNTTGTAVFTIVPNVPVIAISDTQLDVPQTTSKAPSTYVPTETSRSRTDYGTTGSMTLEAPRTESSQSDLETPSSPPSSYSKTYNGSTGMGSSDGLKTSTPVPMSSPIALTSYPTPAKPTIRTYTRTGSDRIVHTENSQYSLDTPTTTRTYTYPPPSPVFLTRFTSVAHPTMATAETSEYASPIALTSYPSVAGPTLPESQQAQNTPTYIPAIVHTEIPAESLDTPPGQTYATPGRPVTTTQTARPVPGAGDSEGTSTGAVPGESPSTSGVPDEVIFVPTTFVTMAPNMVITMGGYQSTITLGESGKPAPSMLVTTIPDHVVTMSGGQVVTVPAAVFTLPVLPVSGPSSMPRSEPSETTRAGSSSMSTQTSSSDAPSGTEQPPGSDGSGSEEGAAPEVHLGSWVYPLLGMAIGAVAVM